MRMFPVLILVLSVVNTLSRVKLVHHCSMDKFLGIIVRRLEIQLYHALHSHSQGQQWN